MINMECKKQLLLLGVHNAIHRYGEGCILLC